MTQFLGGLFAPRDATRFRAAFDSHRRFVARSGRADAVEPLLSWREFNGLVTLDRLTSRRCQLLRRGRELPLDLVSVVGDDSERRLAPDWLQQHCQAGLSIVVIGVGKELPAVAALCSMIEREFDVRCGANAYASFSRESALRAHSDDHDVLVLHLAGRKHWSCFGPSEGRRSAGRVDTADLPDAPQWEAVLEPGDILYVPRGDIHRASVQGDASLHLTISLLRPRGRDVLGWWARAHEIDQAFDLDIPVGVSAEALGQHGDQLREALHRLVDTLDLEAFLDARRQERGARTPLNLGLSVSLGPTTQVHPSLRYRPAWPVEGEARLTIHGKTFDLNGAERAVMATLIRHDALSLAELTRASGLSSEQVSTAVSDLARRSLVLLDPGPGPSSRS